MTAPTISQILGAFVHGLAYRDLPAEVIANARMRILDTLGVCLASVGMDYAEDVYDLCAEQGGPETSTTLGRARRMPESWAVLYNGSLAHGNDYDDTHSRSIVHIGGVVVPTALAMAEKLRRDGRDMIAAVVAGYELAARIGMAASKGFHAQGFHPTGVVGVFSATATAAKSMRLCPLEIAHGFGIAGSQASGSLEFLADGAWTKRMHPGWAAHAGIIAAALAARGFTGPARTFEGRYGLYALYANTVEADLDRATRGLGSKWEILETDVKPYPCGHISHPYMDCALALRRDHSLQPQDIAAVELRVPSAAVPILCEPLADKLRPANSYAARFSLPYAVAVSLVRGKAGIDEFSEDEIRNPEVLALCDRTRYVVDDTLPFPQAFPGWVALRLADGRSVDARMDHSRGSRENPLSEEELYAKFEANARRTLPAARVRQIWDTGSRLEELRDIADFADLLALHP
jgi:2-methylcitrate dehydratase PrpD